MTRVVPGVTLLSALLAFAAPSAAQSPPPTTSAPARAAAPSDQSALNKRVSLDLKAMAPRDAFKVIANAIGDTAEVAPDVSTPVDIVVGNISARTALNTICESIGCTWQASGTVIRVAKAEGSMVGMPRRRASRADEVEARSAGVAELRRLMDQVLPADVKFEHVPLAEVAVRLSKATGFEVTLVGTRPGETFSGDLGGRPFSAALKAIGEQLEGTAATITISGRKDTGAPSIKIQVAAIRKPRK